MMSHGNRSKELFKSVSVSLSKEKRYQQESTPRLIGVIILTSVRIFLTRRRLMTCFLCEHAVHQTLCHKGIVDFGKFAHPSSNCKHSSSKINVFYKAVDNERKTPEVRFCLEKKGLIDLFSDTREV